MYKIFIIIISSKYSLLFYILLWVILFKFSKPINPSVQWNQKIKNNLIYGINDFIHDLKFIAPSLLNPFNILLFSICYLLAIIWVIFALILLILSKFIKLEKFWYRYFIDFVDIFSKKILGSFLNINKIKILIILNRILIIKITNFSILFINIAVIFYFSIKKSKNFNNFCFNCLCENENSKLIFDLKIHQGEKIYTPIQEINNIKFINFRDMVKVEASFENHMLAYMYLQGKINIINEYLNKNIKITKIKPKINYKSIYVEYIIIDHEELLFKNIISINDWKGQVSDIGNYEYYYTAENIKKIKTLKLQEENKTWKCEWIKIYLEDKYKIIFEFDKKNVYLIMEIIIVVQKDIDNKIIIFKDWKELEVTKLNKKDLINFIENINSENIKIVIQCRSKLKYIVAIKQLKFFSLP